MAIVVLLGTLDTKGPEYAYVRDLLQREGINVVVVDTGVLGDPYFPPEVSRSEVAQAGGADLSALVKNADRGAAVAAMAEGAAVIVRQMRAAGRCDGALALGGTGGTAIATRAFRDLPLGVPKVVVSTAASGDTRGYVGVSDIILIPSVVDVAGLNRISTQIFANAAAAVAGMVLAKPPSRVGTKPLVAASMFGVTTPCVSEAKERLEATGYEVLVFHMTGIGGRTLESLALEGQLEGVLDVTTTELADELVGGVFSAGSSRLTAAGKRGVPQVVSVGALDMVNFGPLDSVPTEFAERNLYVHNPQVTLMRTTPDECEQLGRMLAERVSRTTGPATIFLPLRGVSMIAKADGPFYDPDADQALFSAIRDTADRNMVEIVEIDTDINDPRFAAAMGDKLHALISATEQLSATN